MARRTPQLARDPTAHIECHDVDDRFVPVRVCDLVEAVGEEFARAGLEAGSVGGFADALCLVIEQEAAGLERRLAELYSFFNPDRDTLPLDSDAAARTPEGYASLERLLNYLLDKANFERLDDVQLDRVVQVAGTRGIRVRLDPRRIERLAVFVRGSGEIRRPCRTWRKPLKAVEVALPVYRRLVVIARLKDDPHVLLKMFKDIPEADVEALLPHAEITMNWLDRLFMISGGVGAVGSTTAQVMKLISASLVVMSRLLWVVFFGAAVLVWRTLRGYRYARQQRDSQRTRHLYYQNLSNNAGTVHILVSMIALEDAKEAALAYGLCAAGRGPIGSEAELKARVEAYLRERFGVAVDFDAGDAAATLDRLGLWADRAAFRVLPPAEAAARLREHWRESRSRHYHWERCRVS